MRSKIITCDFCYEDSPWKGEYEPGWALLEVYCADPLQSAQKFEICPKCLSKILKLRANA